MIATVKEHSRAFKEEIAYERSMDKEIHVDEAGELSG